jgi:hypothetical protein
MCRGNEKCTQWFGDKNLMERGHFLAPTHILEYNIKMDLEI